MKTELISQIFANFLWQKEEFHVKFWLKLLLKARIMVITKGPVSTGCSEFLPEDPLPKLLPEFTGESPAE